MTLSAAVIVALAALAQSQAPAPPATTPKPYDCSAPEYRQFDFWVGDWDVVTNPAAASAGAPASGSGNGKPASNIVLKAHDGCVIVENWDDRVGGTGQSFNIFDRQTRRWHQTWVDNGGGLHEYWGQREGGNMVFLGEVPLGPAQKFAGRRTVRLTFSPMGASQVRQFSESLGTDGTWRVNYDLIYTRRTPRP